MVTTDELLAEQQLIFELFLENKAISEAFVLLQPEDFTMPQYREIFADARKQWLKTGSNSVPELLVQPRY